MAVIKLYGRERELGLLRRLREPFLAVVYGRRRVGKTALVLKFLEERPHLYFFVNPRKPSRLLLEEYGEALRRAAGLPGYVRFASWDEFFDVLFSLRGYAVAFDEFQRLAEVAPEVPYILQRFWDTRAEKPSLTSSPPYRVPLGRLIGALARPSAAPRAGVMELPGPAPRVIRPQQGPSHRNARS